MKRAFSLFLTLALTLPLLCVGAWAAREEGDSGLLWLVNYDHSISSGYVPEGLQGGSGGLRSEAYTAFQAMMGDMTAAGNWAYLTSAYRSYSTQNGLFQRRLGAKLSAGQSYDRAFAATRRYTAVPGTSEHQLGLAADVTTNGTLTDSFAYTGAGKWLYAHCAEYGFIRRYDGAKESLTQVADEAWHFRYVGLPHSLIMAEKNWCLEEYIAYLRENKSLVREDGSDLLYCVTWYPDKPASLSPYALDCSRDNLGGWIVTEHRPADPLCLAEGHPAAPALHRLFDRGGIPQVGLVDPDSPISRADFAALYAQLPLPQAGTPAVFADVPAESPYRPALDRLGRAGVVSSGSVFSPDRPVKRSEAAAFVSRILPDHELVWLEYGDLAKIPAWAFQSVQQVTAHGLMGPIDGCFLPDRALTWGEAATLLCALEDLLSSNG